MPRERLTSTYIVALDAIARQPLTLHDGTVIPQGAHVRMAAYNIGVDPEREANADIFDGFRYYHARQRPGEENGHRMHTLPPPHEVLRRSCDSNG